MDCLVTPSSELKKKVTSMKEEDKFAYLLAMLCGIKGEVSSGWASTPVSNNVNVVDTVGGTVITGVEPSGQFVEIMNIGTETLLLRINGDPAFGTPDMGFPLVPGAMYVTPERIKTAIKGIAFTGTSSCVHYTRFP